MVAARATWESTAGTVQQAGRAYEIADVTAAAMLVGALHVRSGLLTLGELLLVMSYLAQLYEPLRVVSSKIPEVGAWLVSLEPAPPITGTVTASATAAK